MAKTRNYNVYGSVDYINRLKEEYDWLGRQCRIVAPGHLVVLALPERKKDTKKSDNNKGRRSHENGDGRQANAGREDRGAGRVR